MILLINFCNFFEKKKFFLMGFCWGTVLYHIGKFWLQNIVKICNQVESDTLNYFCKNNFKENKFALNWKIEN